MQLYVVCGVEVNRKLVLPFLFAVKFPIPGKPGGESKTRRRWTVDGGWWIGGG